MGNIYRDRIETLFAIDEVDKMRTQTKTLELQNVTHPNWASISQSMVGRVEGNFKEFEPDRDIQRACRILINEANGMVIVLIIRKLNGSQIFIHKTAKGECLVGCR